MKLNTAAYTIHSMSICNYVVRVQTYHRPTIIAQTPTIVSLLFLSHSLTSYVHIRWVHDIWGLRSLTFHFCDPYTCVYIWIFSLSHCIYYFFFLLFWIYLFLFLQISVFEFQLMCSRLNSIQMCLFFYFFKF